MRAIVLALFLTTTALALEARPSPPPTATEEDAPTWDCERQGNLICNPGYLSR